MDDTPATVVLVHGAWHGAWCWDEVVSRLDDAGVPNVAVENPSVASAPSDLAADGDNLTNVLDGIEGPIVLVGHSYGGAVITDAGGHPQVEHLVYLTAFALDEGESVMDNQLTGGEDTTLAEALQLDGDVFNVDPARIVDSFFHDCTPDVAARAAAQFSPMSMPALSGTPRRIAWRAKPATYIVCTDDHALPVALQQANAARIGTVVELPTSHSPFLSDPDALAAVLVELSHVWRGTTE